MAISGRLRTMLGMLGVPFWARRGDFVTTLDFQLQVSGPVAVEFNEQATVQECQEDNRGVRLIVQVLDANAEPINLRPMTPRVIRLLKPDGTSADFDASLLTNGMDGKLYIDTQADNLTFAGLFRIQALLGADDDLITTRVGKFWVRSNIVEPEVP